jgi:hypothetical protein
MFRWNRTQKKAHAPGEVHGFGMVSEGRRNQAGGDKDDKERSRAHRMEAGVHMFCGAP